MFLVSESFLESSHGELGCIMCHGGQDRPDKEEAHIGMISKPSSYPEENCGQCHAAVVETYETSLHATVRGMANSLITFSGDPHALDNPHTGLGNIFDLNCFDCHATCGECHVSRPSVYAGGLINEHQFFNTPPMDQTCFGCHGARNAGEFMGTVGFGRDVHYEMGMTCMDCHDISNFHGTGEAYASMWEKPTLPSCAACHQDQIGSQSTIQAHILHEDILSCQACHAQANQNCFECHVAYADDRKSVASSSEMRILFRIGLNPNPTEERPFKYTTLRHIPTTANSFIEAGEGLLPNFNEIPNWKHSPTHNVQRSTFQNESCNSCHGNTRIFLREGDIRETSSKANLLLIPDVPEALD